MIRKPSIRTIAKRKIERLLISVTADHFDLKTRIGKAPFPVLDLPFPYFCPVVFGVLAMSGWRHPKSEIIPRGLEVTDKLQEQ